LELCFSASKLLKAQDMKDDDFLIKLQQKLFEIDLLIDEYEMRDRLLSIFVAGILEPQP
jgi:hypothetical protein